MAFYYGSIKLGDTYDEAEEKFLDEYLDECDDDFSEFLIENIGMKALIKWCLSKEEFFETFEDSIAEAREQVARWFINEIED